MVCFPFASERIDSLLRWDPQTECVSSASSESGWWVIGQRRRCFTVTFPVLVPIYEEFSSEENRNRESGIHVLVAMDYCYLPCEETVNTDNIRDIWSVGEDYHVDWINSPGFRCGLKSIWSVVWALLKQYHLSESEICKWIHVGIQFTRVVSSMRSCPQILKGFLGERNVWTKTAVRDLH